MVGNNVSHSKRRTKRRFYPNLVTKKFYLPEEDKLITLKISTSALRTINKKGISACVKEATSIAKQLNYEVQQIEAELQSELASEK